MATVEKLAVINVDPEVQAAIDRALGGSAIPIGVRRPAERQAGYPLTAQMDRKMSRNV